MSDGVTSETPPREEVGRGSTPSGSSDPGLTGGVGHTPEGVSSASESGSAPTQRDFQRAKSGLVHVSEHLRDKLMLTKKALDKEVK